MNRGPFNSMPPRGRAGRDQEADFDQFEATELYCQKCGQAVPVRKSLLLILPEGEKYEYRCQFCGATVGDKIDRAGEYFGVLRP